MENNNTRINSVFRRLTTVKLLLPHSVFEEYRPVICTLCPDLHFSISKWVDQQEKQKQVCVLIRLSSQEVHDVGCVNVAALSFDRLVWVCHSLRVCIHPLSQTYVLKP